MNAYGMSDLFKQGFDLQQNLMKNWMDALSTVSEQQKTAAEKPAEEDKSAPFLVMTRAYQDLLSRWQNNLAGKSAQGMMNPFQNMNRFFENMGSFLGENPFAKAGLWKDNPLMSGWNSMNSWWSNPWKGMAGMPGMPWKTAAGAWNPWSAFAAMQGPQSAPQFGSQFGSQFGPQFAAWMTNPMSNIWAGQNFSQMWANNPWVAEACKFAPWLSHCFNAGNLPFEFADKMMHTGKAFMDLVAIWQKMISQSFASRDEIVKFIEDNRASLEQMSEDLIMPFVPEGMRPFIDQVRSLTRQYETLAREAAQPWKDVSHKSVEEIQNILKGDSEACTSLYKAMYNAYEESFGKMFSMAGVGLSREQNAEIMSQYDAFFKMMLALIELLSLTTEVSKENMVETVEAYQDMMKKGDQPKSIRSFYEMWTKVSQGAFQRVFGTPQFAQIFAEFSRHACDFKIHSDMIVEKVLHWAPNAPKAPEMNGLYRTVDDLRKTEASTMEDVQSLKDHILALEKKVAALSGNK